MLGAVLLLAVGGVLAGLNHTRYDVELSLLGIKFYDSKSHDVHHRIPQSNYGQYVMLWDYIFGTNYIPEENGEIELGFDDIDEFEVYRPIVMANIRYASIL